MTASAHRRHPKSPTVPRTVPQPTHQVAPRFLISSHSDFRKSLPTYDDTIFLGSRRRSADSDSLAHSITTRPVPLQAAHLFSFVSFIPTSECLWHTWLCRPINHLNLEDTRPDTPQSTEEPPSTYRRGQAPRSSFNAERRIFRFCFVYIAVSVLVFVSFSFCIIQPGTSIPLPWRWAHLEIPT